MQRYYLLFSFLIFYCATSFSQSVILSKEEKAALDSMMANDTFLQLLNEKEKNTFDISVGIGNGAFSANNQAANATGITNQLIYTPGIMYRLKNGLSFGLTGYITADDNKKADLYQTGVTAGYTYQNKKVNTGISYTRFLNNQNKYNSKSLYQNDIYGYIGRASGILQPRLALGYSSGNYKEASFTSFLLTRPLRGDTLISGMDSTNNKTSYFSVSACVEHNFSFYKIFNKNDGLEFTPALIINAGSDKFTQTHTNKIYDRFKKLNAVKKVEVNNSFQLQSIAASFDVMYSIGHFFLQPTLYLDYYLPQTTSKKLSTIFSVSAGVSF
jgi:hypothetical protein